jgi:hypothetical protein
MIHCLQVQALQIGDIPRDMEREYLPSAAQRDFVTA